MEKKVSTFLHETWSFQQNARNWSIFSSILSNSNAMAYTYMTMIFIRWLNMRSILACISINVHSFIFHKHSLNKQFQIPQRNICALNSYVWMWCGRNLYQKSKHKMDLGEFHLCRAVVSSRLDWIVCKSEMEFVHFKWFWCHNKCSCHPQNAHQHRIAYYEQEM